MPMDMPPRQRAERGLAMLRAGFLGERNGPPARDPEAMAVLFDSIRRNVDMRRAPDGPFVLQWEFPDAEPWHVRLDNGATAAAPGRAPQVDLELRCRFDDWVDVVAGRLDPRRAVATGRLRPRGNAAGAVARPRPVHVLTVRVIRISSGCWEQNSEYLPGLVSFFVVHVPPAWSGEWNFTGPLRHVDVVGLEAELLPLEPDPVALLHGQLAGA